MGLFLLDFATPGGSRAAIAPLLARVDTALREAGGTFIEAQVADDLRRIYVVAEHAARADLLDVLTRADLAVADVAAVRLVGTTLDDVKATRGAAGYLVEWDLPAGLTMDAYLARKQAKAPLYANVPEVQFLRTYVREDMAKCLCFYDAPDEAAVRRAREAVGAPVDRLAQLDGARHGAR